MTKFVQEREWEKYHQPKELAIAMSIEVNELLELFLFRNYPSKVLSEDQALRGRLSEEIADVFAYLISIVNTLNLDLTTIFLNKMKKNRIKYPTSDFNGNYDKK